MGQESLAPPGKDALYPFGVDIANWIRAARLHKKWTQTQLADHLGLTKGNISGWENRRHQPSFDQLLRVEALTGYPLLSHDASTVAFSVAEPAAPPPLPPRDFTDRREVSDTDWDTLQAVKVMFSDTEIEDLKRRYRLLQQRAELIKPTS